ncbi:MAG: AraC family transcriptional regulator [Hyphomicrobiales bacterium]|nr:AraC family transcriptional regulator [Hyphomicrobiales bacterium]MBV9433321.1 AraC family transcriptional regulator [Hyphomicrobiales bacterium]MBV9738326.1 AraC family transcriptional regulator [Hyphomicrobiales bacterium]
MSTNLDPRPRPRLERSCGPSPTDWIRQAPADAGVARIEASFSGHAYDLHRHDTYALGYTLSGVQSFDFRGARHDSLPNNVVVIFPDEMHNGRAGARCGFRYKMLYIEPRLLRDALGETARGLPFLRVPISTSRPLLEALLQALDDLDHPLEGIERDQIIFSVAQALLALDPSVTKSRVSDAPCRLAVERAREFLDAHYMRMVGSEELEAITGLSRYALARHFRARLGTSPYRYLTMRRLDRAKSMIRAGDPLADAAQASGFADQSHMTRLFGRAFGMSPGRWHALHAQAGAGARSPSDKRRK